MNTALPPQDDLEPGTRLSWDRLQKFLLDKCDLKPRLGKGTESLYLGTSLEKPTFKDFQFQWLPDP